MPRTAGSPGARIAGLGSYVPDRVLTNDELSRAVETSDTWIVQRTGIRERRVAADDEFTSDLCAAAARDLAARRPGALDGVDLIVVATTTPDYAFPSVAALVQARLGILGAGAIDLNATCAGFAYGLHVANGLVTAGLHRKVLVVGGETLSKVLDYADRATCVLFGDGAGAAVVERDEGRGRFLGAHVGAEGAGGVHLYRTGLSRRIAPDGEGAGLVRQNGREVYRWAVETVAHGVVRLATRAGLNLDEVDWFVPHSANARIVEAVCARVGFPADRTLTSQTWYGNTSSATIPLALADAERAGRLRPGDTVLLYGFGGGLVHAGVLVEWAT